MGKRSTRGTRWNGSTLQVFDDHVVPIMRRHHGLAAGAANAEAVSTNPLHCVAQRRQQCHDRRHGPWRSSCLGPFRRLVEPADRPQLRIGSRDREHSFQSFNRHVDVAHRHGGMYVPQRQAIPQQPAKRRVCQSRGPEIMSSAILRCCHLPSSRLPLNTPPSTTILPRSTVRHGHASILRPSHGV